MRTHAVRLTADKEIPMKTGAIEEAGMTEEAADQVQSATVMVVHESRQDRAALRHAVERAGMNARLVLEASNGYEALALIAAVRVDLVLLPAEMRLMPSAELITRIREGTRRETKFVLVVDDETAARVSEKDCAGADAVVMMPVAPEELRRVAEGALGK
jgi:PleD family two-component response regulator